MDVTIEDLLVALDATVLRLDWLESLFDELNGRHFKGRLERPVAGPSDPQKPDP